MPELLGGPDMAPHLFWNCFNSLEMSQDTWIPWSWLEQVYNYRIVQRKESWWSQSKPGSLRRTRGSWKYHRLLEVQGAGIGQQMNWLAKRGVNCKDCCGYWLYWTCGFEMYGNWLKYGSLRCMVRAMVCMLCRIPCFPAIEHFYENRWQYCTYVI